VWLSQAYDVDALTALALIGQKVPAIALGTAVTTIHSRHPIAMSSQTQTAQAATGGRLRLGLGVGHRKTVEDRYGYPFDQPAERMRDYLEALLPLLRDGTVAHHGLTTTADTTGFSAHVAGSTMPPVLVAALAPRMLRVAGELANGTVTWLAGPRTIAEHIQPALSAAAAGRPSPEIVAGLPVCLTSEPDVARQRAATNLAFYEGVPSYQSLLEREGARSTADVAIIGDERHVAQCIRRLADSGVTHLIANTTGIATPVEHARSLEFLGTL
jgi:F420-dependent oxidoreductase-like protein